jgi:hypothetical protein
MGATAIRDCITPRHVRKPRITKSEISRRRLIVLLADAAFCGITIGIVR